MSKANVTPLPDALESIFTSGQPPDAVFSTLMPALCEVLKCDRCFLQVRAATGRSRITHCYCRDSQRANLTESDWSDQGDIAAKDPLMAIAFRTAAAVFVEDIETAGADILDLDYERADFGHRALIHAPIYWEDQLVGILEPCVFELPRVWTAADRLVIATVQERLAPLVGVYLSSAGL